MTECYRKYFYYNDELWDSCRFSDAMIDAGKSIYDVIRIYKGVPLFLDKYLKRLKTSAKLANIDLWLTDEQITKKILTLIEENEVDEDSLKIVFSFQNIFSGTSQNLFLAYLMRNNAPTPQQYIDGIFTISHYAERKIPNAKLVNTMLRKNSLDLLKKHNAYEVILVDKNDFITEGSRSNFFVLKDNNVFTPYADKVLPGVTRENTIQLCKENNIVCNEIFLKYDELSEYDSAFITGTSRRILPVKKLDNFTFDVSNATMRKLMFSYNELINNYIATFDRKNV